MRLHGFGIEEAALTPGGWVVKKRCRCRLLFIGRAPSLQGALQVISRRYQDHRGFAAAAGPGWQATT